MLKKERVYFINKISFLFKLQIVIGKKQKPNRDLISISACNTCDREKTSLQQD